MHELAGNVYHLLGNIPTAINYLDSATQGARVEIRREPLTAWQHWGIVISILATISQRTLSAPGHSNLPKKSPIHSKIYALVHLLNLYQASGLPELGLQYMYRINELHPPAIERPGGMENVIMRWAHDLSCETYIKLGKRDSARWIAQFVPSRYH
jgi:hypothetical protein